MGLWIRKAVEHFKCCLISHASRSMEDSGAKCDLMNCGCLDPKVSEGQNIIWPKDHHSCDILVKNVADFALV